MDDRANDEQSSLAPTEECEEDEENSLLDLEGSRAGDNVSEHSQAAFRSSMSIKVRNCFYFKTLFYGLLRGWQCEQTNSISRCTLVLVRTP